MSYVRRSRELKLNRVPPLLDPNTRIAAELELRKVSYSSESQSDLKRLTGYPIQ